MTIWTVYAPPSPGISPEPTDDLVFVREGFSWTALILAPIWALAHRLWLTFVLWLAAMIAISLVAHAFGIAIGWVLTIGFLIWFGLAAGDFRRAKLSHRGWRLIDVVDARSRKLAELRYFEKIAGQQRPGEARDPNTPPPAPPARPGAYPPVVGFMTDARA